MTGLLVGIGLTAALFMAAAFIKARAGCSGACSGCEKACVRNGDVP
jgi:hypothetical protein